MTREKHQKDTVRKPYVRYMVSGDPKNKGIGYSIKKSAIPFLNQHGYEARVTLLDPTSDSFKVIVEFLDNGKYDFNAQALLDHLNHTGQVPDRMRPTITITPIPIDHEIQIMHESKDHIACQKTIEGLQYQIGEKDQQISAREQSVKDITSAMAERQKVIDEQNKKLGNLEKFAATMKHYDTPISAVIGTAVTKSLDSLVDASADWTEVLTSGNGKLYVSDNEVKNYLGFVNAKYGLDFKKQEEFEKWKKETQATTDWSETDKGKELVGQKARLEADQNVLAVAVSSGASESLIEILRTAVKDSQGKITQINTATEELSRKIQDDKRKYALLENSEVEFSVFNQARANSRLRKEAEASINILIESRQGKTPFLRAYLPCFDSSSELETYIHSRLREQLNLTSSKHVEEYNGDVVALESIAQTEEDAQKINQIIATLPQKQEEFLQDKVLASLGLKPKIININELE